MTGNDPDLLLLRRARRHLAAQNVLAFALILLLVAAVVAYVDARGQRAALASSLKRTAATEEDVVDPPGGTWIFTVNADGQLSSTRNAPDGFPDRSALDRVRAGGATETAAVDVDGTNYLVVTRMRGTRAVQVVGSLAREEGERHRLLAALGLAALLGLAAAAAAAVVLARRATAPLGDALARQRRFVADASHELRTPVTQLHTRVQLLDQDLRAGVPPDRMTVDVQQLLIGTRQLGEVIEDLLLSTQPATDTGSAPEVDLGVVAAGAVAAFAWRARDQGVELVLDPDPDGPSLVRGREAALRRVLTALVDNALSHTGAGGRVTIELRTRDGDRPISVTVRDDGDGIDPADAERIFERFARGHGDQRRFGLGLALAREVVAGHGGTIEASGALGRGAEFTVRLPGSPS
ncbi:signal transduction histidine kinase [Actinoplanes tereljensis]|uniref:histidine kinase n=1 Tax=Paractinoplanes tereljensis TaxID=571912 RepID=A0A919NS87_9ACTN|nr:HAMP domain-containing sensor histidine kinase [Actinoplanes tereljensis]GIF23383.1 two-component sensor histidine kinase [Actinoplanes tereljensis]